MIRRSRAYLFIALILLVLGSQIPATCLARSIQIWPGAEGGTVQALAIGPAASQNPPIYSGTASGGVFKSINSDVSWFAVNNGLTNRDVQTLPIDPVALSTIYAGTNGGGVFKSTDGGLNWSAVNFGDLPSFPSRTIIPCCVIGIQL